jgi:hypothetical protein
MAGLTEVYTGAGADASRRRLAAGGGLFAVGVTLAALGAISGTTELLAGFGYGLYESRRIAGVLAGFGVPAAFLGILVVLPASRRLRGFATAGALLAACGTLWFWTAYPADWAGYGRDLTLPVTALYLAGLTVTFGCLFTGVARFKTRNDPGGTVSLDVIRRGETRVGEVERPREVGVGGVGVFGRIDDPSEPDPGSEPRGDGGTETSSPSPSSSSSPSSPVDRYCGNCAHVDYARDGGKLRPYCAHHERLLDSMDPCEVWTANTDGLGRAGGSPPESGD